MRACALVKVPAQNGSPEKPERARALGASEAIDHHKQDIAGEITRLTNRRGVDVVIEHVGEADVAEECTLAGTRGTSGRLRRYHRSARPARSDRVLRQAFTIPGASMGTKGELMRAARACFFAGQLTPVVDRAFPRADAAQAQQRMEESGQFGKIVLEVP